MSEVFRANLSSAVFPMTLADAGRTVISQQGDQNYDKRVDPQGTQKDAGIPQAIYLQDVIPTVNGYQSIGYNSDTKPMPPRQSGTGTLALVQSFVVDVPGRSLPAILVQRQGTLSYHDVVSIPITFSTSWQYQATTVRPVKGLEDSTIATVRGVNYWCDGNTIFSFTIDPNTYQVTFLSLLTVITGITIATIKAICSSYNYLIAIDDNNVVHWSSTTTPTDFVPSLVTGAGSEIPSDLQGQARFILTHPDGFIIYSDRNAVFARYTGNARYPFKFTPIADAGGYTTVKQVSGNNQSLVHYGLDNSNKVQILKEGRAELVAPEVTTYLERKTYRDTFDYATNAFGKTNLPLYAVHFLLDRYIIIGDFVYDTLLQRYGKLSYDYHSICASDRYVVFIPNNSTGKPAKLSFDIYDSLATFQGVLLLGKFQVVRSRNIKLEGVEVESSQDASLVTPNFSMYLYPSLDGKNFLSPIELTCTFSDELITAPVHNTAKNHSILLKGAFDINTLQLDFTIAGGR
jgi:hypothetical protein